MNFPNMTNPDFPIIDNAFTNAYNNSYDYRLWDKDVEIKLLTVSWDSDGSNVVKFTNDAERDKWFAKATGEVVTLTSAMRIMPDNVINVPIPFDVACRYNYVAVTYPEATVDFGSNKNRLKTFYWFITNVAYAAPSTTKLLLSEDWWTNIINDVEVASAMVERGHIAVANSADVDSYLANPRANTEYLLNDDFSYGELSTVASSNTKVFNANNMRFCIASYADLSGSFGSQHSDSWGVPYVSTPFTNNTPAPFCFGCDASQGLRLLQAIDTNAPQFKRCIAGVFFISADYLKQVSTFTFNEVQCFRYEAINKVENLLKLTKASFGYDSAYVNLAKLYTYPYAAIEVVNDAGSKSLVRIEDTDGTISLATTASVIFPYVSLDARLINIGGVSRSTKFGNIGSDNTFNYGGRFYDYLFKLDVPTFTVSQSNATLYDYASYFDRQQQIKSYTNSYNSAIASNATGYNNATASNATAKTNADNSANNAVSNNAIGTAANSATTARSAQGATTLNGYADTKMRNDYHSDLSVSTASYEAEQAGLATTAAVNTINANAAVATGFISGLSSALTGNVGGVISAATSIANAGVSNETSSMTVAISQSNNQDCYTAATNQGVFKYEAASTYNENATNTNNSVMIDNAATNNNANTSITANNANLIRTNASNSKATGDANASRSKSTADANAERTKDTAINAINNKIKQENLNAPAVFGSSSNGATATTRPMALFANVVTQREGDIASAGDMFLRYGYACDRYVKINKLQVMKYFTYWKCSDIWLTCKRNVIEIATDIIKQYFMNGVTIWDNPDSIGAIGVYQNVKL